MLGAAACEKCGWSPLGAAPAPPTDDLGGGDPFVGGDTPAPTFAAPPPPPPGYAPPTPGSLAAQVAPATGSAKPVPQGGNSGCGCIGFLVVLVFAAAGVGIFLGFRDAGDTIDGVRDAFDDATDFSDEGFDGDRVDMPAVAVDAPAMLQELGTGEVGVHPLDGVTGTVTIRAFGIESFDPFIRVESADGDVLDEDDDGGDGTDALLTIDLTGEPGAVVVVREFGGESGTYNLLVLPGSGTAPTPTGAELTVGTPTGGLIIDAGQVVDHPFVGTGAPVSITVEGITSFDPVVTVLDAAGTELATNDDFDRTNSGSDARVDLTIPAGAQVTVRVSGFGSSEGPYLVTVAAG